MTSLHDMTSMTMPTKRATRQRPNSAGRREQIVEAALKVMLAEGVYRTTTRRIAEAAQVNVATLHYHFHDKEEILLSVMDLLVMGYRAVLARQFADPQPLETRIADLLWFIWGEIERAPEEQLVLQEMTLYVLRQTGVEHLAADKDRIFLQLYADSLRTAVDVGPDEDGRIEQLANFIYTSFVGILNQWLATHDTDLLRATTATLILAAQDTARRLGLGLLTVRHGPIPSGE